MDDDSGELPTLAELREAQARIAPWVHRTPVLSCAALDALAGRRLFLKCEHLQKVGAFKARGACNAVLSLDEAEAARGVITHSSGNHAQALAWAASLRGIEARVVMPENAPAVKVEAVRGYGAEIRFCAPTQDARRECMEGWRAETGAVFIHPYDDWRIIRGQASAALELCDQVPGLDLVVAPVGGGGLLAGTALACALAAEGATAIGAEPEGADDASRSLRDGRIHPSVEPRTIADGLLTSLCARTFAVLRRHVPEILTVSDDEIRAAMRLLLERAKQAVEPSGAASLAAVLSGRMRAEGERVGVILSGGNYGWSALLP